MEELKAFFQSEFQKVHDQFGKIRDEFDNIHVRLDGIESRLNYVEKRLDRFEKRFDDIERVVRESAEDILENQVEEVARHNLHENRLQVLEATTFRIDKSVLDLKRRVEKLEK